MLDSVHLPGGVYGRQVYREQGGNAEHTQHLALTDDGDLQALLAKGVNKASAAQGKGHRHFDPALGGFRDRAKQGRQAIALPRCSIFGGHTPYFGS